MPVILTSVNAVKESLQADTQVVRDRVEQNLESATSIFSLLKDIISGRAPFFLNIGIPTTLSESATNEQIVPARAAPSNYESSQNALLLPAVPVYKISRLLVCVTEVWSEYKVGLGGNPHVEKT